MSSPFSFCRRRFPSTVIFSRGIGPHIVPISSAVSPSCLLLRQFASFENDCASPIKLSLLCYYRSSYAGSGTINIRQTRSSAGSSGIITDISFNKGLFHAHPRATRATKDSELRRLEVWLLYRNLRQKQINQNFDLQLIFRILDEILFDGLLRHRVIVEWIDPKEMPGRLSKTSLASDARRESCLLIEITKPLTSGPWTLAIIRARLDALVDEMTQIYYELYCRDLDRFQHSKKRAVRGLWSSSFKKLLREVKKEADPIFERLPRL